MFVRVDVSKVFLSWSKCYRFCPPHRGERQGEAVTVPKPRMDVLNEPKSASQRPRVTTTTMITPLLVLPEQQ